MTTMLAPHAVHAAHAAGTLRLIDVRTPGEFGAVHIEGASLMPLDRLDPTQVNGPAVLICQSGKRAEQARRQLAAAGCENLAVLEGGVNAWLQAGLPVQRGKSVLSLERQVRIAAGLLVLTGVLLGWFAHPAYGAIAAFAGAGLVFAGITDWCGMAMLLAKMPWNQCHGSCCNPTKGSA